MTYVVPYGKLRRTQDVEGVEDVQSVEKFILHSTSLLTTRWLLETGVRKVNPTFV